MLSEAVIGLSFGIPPIAGGFLYEIAINYVIIYQITILTILIIILLRYHFKYMKSEKLGLFKK